jgi:hypothetical protein
MIALPLVLWAAAQTQEPPRKPATAPALPDAATSAERQVVQRAIDKGLEFLLKDQNKDGSWGGPRNKTMTDSFANVETHHSWTVGTTGLVVMSLLESGHSPQAQAALERGLDYLVANADVKRPADWDTDNTWGMVYGLHGVARALLSKRFEGTPRKEALTKAARQYLKGLTEYQGPEGGWAYYATSEAAYRPGVLSTSFTTAAGVLAIQDARLAGLEIDEKTLAGAVKAVKHCRLPTGAYTYGVDAVSDPSHLEFINQVKGSLGRIQVCNLALYRAKDTVTADDLRKGLDEFFKHHKFLDVGLRKPIPHEAFYAVAAYFYLFGHFYASMVIDELPAAEREAYWKKLRPEVLKTQERDGGAWDFYISGHTKAYGTAFSILVLQRSLGPRG